MKRYWESACAKIDGMSLRERVMMFAAATFTLLMLVNLMLLDPLLNKQKMLSAQMAQQHEKMKVLQAQIQNLVQANHGDSGSPLRKRIDEIKQQLQTQSDYVQARRDRMVEPEKMAELLEQVLKRNAQLQLVELKTLPVSSLLEQVAGSESIPAGSPDTTPLIFKHGVRITVKGSYLEMLRYVTMLEKMPVQMIWGDASMSVEHYPVAVLTLTLYTLSLDKTWLTV